MALACEEAVKAEELTVYGFKSKDEAESFAQSLGQDGYQSDWVVLHYEGAADDNDPARTTYAGTADSMWSSD